MRSTCAKNLVWGWVLMPILLLPPASRLRSPRLLLCGWGKVRRPAVSRPAADFLARLGPPSELRADQRWHRRHPLASFLVVCIFLMLPDLASHKAGACPRGTRSRAERSILGTATGESAGRSRRSPEAGSAEEGPGSAGQGGR